MVRAILFDKDGTLTDFRKTWEAWMPGPIRKLALESETEAGLLAETIGYDLDAGVILADGAFVTSTGPEMDARLAAVTGWSAEALQAWWRLNVQTVQQVAVADLPPLLSGLRARGLALGILTNADEAEARKHLSHMGVLEYFGQIIGHDSGWGGKPAPEGALAFADGLGLAPAEVLVVGDGMTDMLAAARAGMPSVAVLTGTLDRAALAPHARAVLPDISALPTWLDAQLTV